MISDTSPNVSSKSLAENYWDIPEIAALLRVVTHLNIGATVALCLWFAAMTWGGGLIRTVMSGGTINAAGACSCELRLTPIPQARHQIVHATAQPRS